MFFLSCNSIDEKKSDEIIIGSVKYNYFTNSTKQWYTEFDHKKFIDFKIVEKIKPYLSKVSIKVFLGTWCEDSKREIPILFEILKFCGYDMSKVELIGLSREKTSPSKIEKNFDIKRIPTIIFLKNDNELNRIVEYPIESIEKDILKILKSEKYFNAYHNE
tara:strand:- start:592 stop:1074 length:483 start_codon:yes stop_codon:yes gene_type:complete